jgi:tetratricopeptide (TPR) repeat protein
VYERPVFPLSPGRLTIPPAHLSYAMPLSFSFFSREENFELPSDSVVIVAITPPLAARPPDYAGAVGQLHVDAHVDSNTARVGEPMTLTLRVAGVGNIKLLPRPRVEVPWASLVPSGERVSLGSDPVIIRGAKEFDWIITPITSGPVTLPAIRYPYFDPVHERYDVAETVPETLSIAAGQLAALDTAPHVAPRWPIRTVYHGPLPAPPYTRPPFWVLVLIAPLPAAVLVVARRPRRRHRRVRSAAHSLRAHARDASTHLTPRDVRALFLRAIADRIHLASTSLAEPAALERALRRAGTSRETARTAASLLESLNAAAFSAEPRPMRDAIDRAARTIAAIDAEARRFHVPHASVLLVLVVAVALSGAWALAAPIDESTRFALGVDAYEHGRYQEAAAHFSWVADRAPRAPDAWANLGTAAWAAGDTARAALGWERALRLDPLAHDARDHLDSVLPATQAGPGAVPSIPARLVSLLAVALWLAGWLLLAAWLYRKRRGAVLAYGLVGAACVAGLFAAQLHRALAARDLGVVATTQTLHLLPVLNAEATGAVRIGDVARITEWRDAWAYVHTADGHDGWMPRSALLPLDRD